MLKHVSRVRLVGAWLTAVVLIFACRVVWGAAFTINSGQLWLGGLPGAPDGHAPHVARRSAPHRRGIAAFRQQSVEEGRP
jgi:hypothetical protein